MWDATHALRHFAIPTGWRPHSKQEEQLFVRRTEEQEIFSPRLELPIQTNHPVETSCIYILHGRVRLPPPTHTPRLSVAIQAGNDISILGFHLDHTEFGL